MANPLAPSKTSFTFPSRSSLTLHAGLFLLLLLGTISSWSFAKVLCFFPKVFGLPQLCPSSHPLHLLFIQSDCPEHIVSSSIELFLSFKAIPKHPTWIINVHIKNFIAGIFPEIWIDLTTALLLVFTCKLLHPSSTFTCTSSYVCHHCWYYEYLPKTSDSASTAILFYQTSRKIVFLFISTAIHSLQKLFVPQLL